MGTPEALRGVVRGLHHVAIVVPSIADARPSYEGLGMTAGEPEYVADQKVNVLVCMAGDQRIELVEPAADDSPVTSFLAKRGGGLHHLAFRVDDVAQAIETLMARGFTPTITPDPSDCSMRSCGTDGRSKKRRNNGSSMKGLRTRTRERVLTLTTAGVTRSSIGASEGMG